jgi:hypothetical protein
MRIPNKYRQKVVIVFFTMENCKKNEVINVLFIQQVYQFFDRNIP